jgi:hypothetical protein
MFLTFGISCELKREKNPTGDRQEAFTCDKSMFCAVWKKISSMQKGVSTVEDWILKDVETSESETLPTGVCGILP